MNLFGKILVVGVLVMSVLFMGAAMAVWSVNRNYLEANTKLKQLRDSLQNQNRQLQDEQTKLTAQLAVELAAKRRSLARLQNELVALRQDFGTLQAEKAQNVAQTSNANTAMNAMQENIATWRAEMDRLRKQLTDAQLDRDKIFGQLVNLTDFSNQLTAKRDTLVARSLELNAQIAQMRSVLSANNLPLTPEGPEKVDGLVAEVRESYVEISIGKDDGLRIGDTLEVYRGNKYLGRILVERTEPDRAVCKIVKNLQRGYIQRGDNVTTQLKVG